MYLNKNSDSKPTSPMPLSSVNYNGLFSKGKHLQTSEPAIETYDDSYLVEQQLNVNWSKADGDTETNHLGPFWFQWQKGSGYLEY